MAESYVPKQDFGIIGQLPDIYRQGQLRRGLSQLAPDDFQGMARLLMQYGKPEQGVQAMQLATALKHQAFEEDLATKTYGLQSEEAKARLAAQGTELNLKLQDLQKPYANVLSGKDAYVEARKAVLSPGLYGAFKAQYGAPEGIIRNYAGAIADALGKTGSAAKDFVDNSVPQFTDSVPTKLQKLKALEAQAQSVGIFGSRVGAGEAKDYVIPPYEEPPAPTGVPGSQTQAPPNPYAPTSNVAVAPSSSLESAQADPRGALLPQPGQKQGMNRQLAPVGQKISDGNHVFQKQPDGKWKQIQ